MPAQQAQTFGDVLKRYRGRAALTQEELAEAAGISLRGLSDLERGISAAPRAATLELLIAALKLGSEERAELEASARRQRGASPPDLPFVAVCHAPEDRAIAERLLLDVRAGGLAGWLDGHDLRAGTAARERVLRDALRAAQAVLLVVSPGTRASRHVADALRIAEMYRSTVYPIWVAGERWPDCAPAGWDAARYVDARAGSYAQGLRELLVALSGENGRTAAHLTAPPPGDRSAPPRNPYKGLRAFTGPDAHDFFGRERLVAALVASLHPDAPGAPRILVVVGPSGSGKSSLVQAGMLPALRGGTLPGSERWVYLEPLVPGAHPLEALAVALHAALPSSSLKTIRNDLEDSPRALHLLASGLAGQGDHRLVLVVDQFEELFTLTMDEDERQQFIDLLVIAVTEPRGPLLAILTLRADFYDRPMGYPALVGLLESRSKLIPPMTVAELRAAIEGPAALPDVRLAFELDLAGDLLFEVRGETGALPLLQFTLDQLFERREGHGLTVAAYHELGGVRGALARHAEAIFAALPSDEHRRLARALFLRLIDPGTTEQDTTRRRAALRELELPDPRQTQAMRAVADAFVAARLLVTNEHAGVTTIEVSHEALIREWGRVADWLREAREDVRLQQAVSADAAAWLRRARPADHLYRGSVLDEALAWAGRHTPSKDEHAFLHAAVAERERQAQAERARQARELETQRQAANRLRALVGVLAVFLVVAVGLSVFAINQARTANQAAADAARARNAAVAQSRLSLSSQLAAQAINDLSDKYDLSLLLSVEANRISDTVEARSSLLRVLEYNPRLITILRGHSGAVLSVAFSPDGRTLATGGADGTIRRWTVAGGQPLGTPLTGSTAGVSSVAFSPDGRTLAAATGDGTLRLWDARRGVALGAAFADQPTVVTNVVFSPNGRVVAVAGNDGVIRLWDVARRQPIGPTLTDHVSVVSSLAFSPGGAILAAGAADGTIRLWDVRTGRTIGAQLRGHTDSVTSLAFSPDGRTLASGSADRTVRLWDVAHSRAIGRPLGGFGDGVTGVAFSPDGATLAASSSDRTIRLWDVRSGQPAGPPLPSLPDAVNGIAFSPDGRILASANGDGSVWLWDMTRGSSLSLPLLGHTDVVNDVAFSPDGRMLVSASGDNTLRRWDVARGRPIGAPLRGHTDSVTSVAFSPDGKTIASGSNDDTILLTDAASGRTIGQPLTGPNDVVTSLAFSPDGTLLASGSGSDDGTVWLWDVARRQQIGEPLGNIGAAGTGTGVGANSVAFSPNGKLLAVGFGDGHIQHWDVATRRPIDLPFVGHTDSVTSVAFSPDGTILASGSADRTIRLWSVATGQQIAPPFQGHTDYITSVAFSPDGTMLASGSGDGTVRLWDVASGQQLGLPLTGHQGAVTSVAFSPDGKLLASGGADHTVRLWQVSPAAWMQRACRAAHRNLQPLEWKRYLLGEPYSATCPVQP